MQGCPCPSRTARLSPARAALIPQRSEERALVPNHYMALCSRCIRSDECINACVIVPVQSEEPIWREEGEEQRDSSNVVVFAVGPTYVFSKERFLLLWILSLLLDFHVHAFDKQSRLRSGEKGWCERDKAILRLCSDWSSTCAPFRVSPFVM